MAEGQTQNTSVDGQAQGKQAQAEPIQAPQAQAQAAQADTTDWKAEARKWEAWAKKNKAKADAYDEAQEAAKSDLQKALEQSEKWKSEYESLKAESDRKDAVARASREYGVDAETLSRMAGDVDDNARFLRERAKSAQKYPSVYDGGQQAGGSATRDSIESEKDPVQRVMRRAEHIEMYRGK